ncbi:MAG: hypothetical protein AAF098_14585 [Pseudomonadota bacterium]
MQTFLLTYTVLAFALSAQAIAAMQSQKKVRFSLQVVEERCVDSTNTDPWCDRLLLESGVVPETKVADGRTRKKTELAGHQVLAVGDSGVLATCFPEYSYSWDVTFKQWHDDAALIDFVYESDSASDCEDDGLDTTALSTQLVIGVPSRQRVVLSTIKSSKGSQRSVVANYLVLTAEAE